MKSDNKNNSAALVGRKHFLFQKSIGKEGDPIFHLKQIAISERRAECPSRRGSSRTALALVLTWGQKQHPVLERLIKLIQGKKWQLCRPIWGFPSPPSALCSPFAQLCSLASQHTLSVSHVVPGSFSRLRKLQCEHWTVLWLNTGLFCDWWMPQEGNVIALTVRQ